MSGFEYAFPPAQQPENNRLPEIKELYGALERIVLAARPGIDDELNTDPNLRDTLTQIRLEALNGTPVIIRTERMDDAPADSGASNRFRFHVDTLLDPTKPNEVTRLAVSGPHDDEPNEIAAVTSIFTPTGKPAYNIILKDDELDNALMRIRAYLDVDAENNPQNGFFVDTELSTAFQIPELTDRITGVEAAMYQTMIDRLLTDHDIVPTEIDPTHSVHFAVGYLSGAYQLPITDVMIKMAGPDDGGSEGLIASLSINKPNNRIGRLIVQLFNRTDGSGPEIRFFESLPESKYALTALNFATRHLIYAAMEQQLVPGNVALRRL